VAREYKSTNRGAILLGDFVFDHLAALHHELDPVEFADVFERVARDRNQVSEFCSLHPIL